MSARRPATLPLASERPIASMRPATAAAPMVLSLPPAAPPPLRPAAERPSAELDLLLARLADGDRSAFSPAFAQLRPPIERLCRSLLENDADADDATQEALKKIFERASDYDASRPALPWALALAGWECRTLRKKRTRRREAAFEPTDEPSDDQAETRAVELDLARAALTALGELSEPDREVLLATFWDEDLDLPGATVRKRRSRALSRLRRTFGRLYGND